MKNFIDNIIDTVVTDSMKVAGTNMDYSKVIDKLLTPHLGTSLSFYASKIIFAFIVFLIVYGIGCILRKFIIKLIKGVFSGNSFVQEESIFYSGEKALQRIILFTAALCGILLVIPVGSMVKVIYRIYRIAVIFVVTDGLVSSMEGIIKVMAKINNKESLTNDAVMRFLSKIAKFLVVTFGILIILSEMGIDVNGIIAGLGLGGVTFALAAKDTATNMFGGVNIIVDKPFIVGDWIATSDVEGIVEDITFRSTRIRTFFDSVVVVPNSTLSNDNITNWSRMNKRKDSFTFGISYMTDRVTIEDTLKKIEAMIKSHKNVFEDTVIVRLDSFGASSIDIYVVYFINLLQFAEAKGVREEISFGIIDILHEANVEFAFPSRTIYMAKD